MPAARARGISRTCTEGDWRSRKAPASGYEPLSLTCWGRDTPEGRGGGDKPLALPQNEDEVVGEGEDSRRLPREISVAVLLPAPEWPKNR